MNFSRNRKVKTKKKTPSKSERFCDVLLRILSTYPPEERYTGWAFGLCRRCRAQLYAVRTSRDDTLLLLFCQECQWYCLDEDNPAFVRALRTGAQYEPSRIPSPLRPLERSIHKHMRSIKTEGD